MWVPISANYNNYTAYVPPEKREQAEEKASEKHSRKSSAANASQSRKPQGRKVTADKKTVQTQSAERPISGGRAEKVPVKKGKKKTGKKAHKKVSLQKISEAVKAENISVPGSVKSREKTNKTFLRLVRSGKSVDQARAIIAKRKLRKRKLSSLLSVMFLFLFAVTFLVCYTYCEGAQVKDIIIDGDEVYTHEEILTAANLSEGVNMLTVREKDVNENVVTVLPFISEINVKYDLPDTLRLNVISTSERFIFKCSGKYICVDKTGKVVSEKKKKLSKGQYIVTGLADQEYTVGEKFVPSEENKQKYEIAFEIASAADNNEVINCGTIDVSDVGNLTLTYKSRLRVYLGTQDKLSSKLAIAEQVMNDNQAQNKTGYINAKYDIAAYFMQGTMDA